MKYIVYGALLFSMASGRAFGGAFIKSKSEKNKVMKMRAEAKYHCWIQVAGGSLAQTKGIIPVRKSTTASGHTRPIMLMEDIALHVPTACENCFFYQEACNRTSSLEVVFTEIYECNGKKVYPILSTTTFGVSAKDTFENRGKYFNKMLNPVRDDGVYEALEHMENDEEEEKRRLRL